MRIIIPMAGMGKRLRPHTLTIPKPLLPVAGKPIVQRLVEDIIQTVNQPVEEVAFVTGRFGTAVEEMLLSITKNVGSKGKIYYQDEALGTAHAIHCAKESLKGHVVVAFADTLFQTDFKMLTDGDGVIWVKKVEDPRAFGVVKVNKENVITDFIEKPEKFVSDLAIIGIYYFRSGENLSAELQYLMDNNIRDKGEYQLTSALENMKAKGAKFFPGTVSEWLDCGNKDATVATNKRLLELNKGGSLVSKKIKSENAVIIEPCFVADGVELRNTVIGPFASIHENCRIENSVIENSIVQANTVIRSSVLDNSMIGKHVECSGTKSQLSLGDYSTLV